MNKKTASQVGCGFAIAASLIILVEAVGQVPSTPLMGQAEVTGNDVYVRSGASANHYPVCKLSAGDRVTVVAQRGEWYEIKPPAGSYSYIHGDYVDTSNDRSGVVNGDRVNVRVGSTLPLYADEMYAHQPQLSRGAQVEILERLPTGYLRVKPPATATLWISRQFVELVPTGRMTLAPGAASQPSNTTANPTPGESTTGTPTSAAPGATATTEAPAANAAEAKPTVLGGMSVTPQRTQLVAIDEAAQEELEKPATQRQFTPLIERYQAIAEQEEDQFAQRYAQARMDQLANMAALAETILTMRRLGEESDLKRREFLEERAGIGATLPPIPRELDARGELRISALYPRSLRPERFRLVDSVQGRDRTVGYIEIPTDSGIDADAFLGRFVGVRASAKRLQTGGVDPVPIFVARELVLLEPLHDEKDASEDG